MKKFTIITLVLMLLASTSVLVGAGPRKPNRGNPAPLTIPVYDFTPDAWSGFVQEDVADWNAALATLGEDRLVYQRGTVATCDLSVRPTAYGISVCEKTPRTVGASMGYYDPGVAEIHLYNHDLTTPYLGVVCHEMTHALTRVFDHYPDGTVSCIGSPSDGHPSEFDISTIDLSWFSPYYKENRGQGPDRTNGPHKESNRDKRHKH